VKLVYTENNRPVTDSLNVAEKFIKEHRRVMQDIRDLGCSDEFRQHHFVLSSYMTSQNKELPKYIMTEQGFTLLAMGYTGDTAMSFKEDYISEFTRMRQQLTDPYAALSPELRAVILMDTKVQKLENRVEEIDSKVETQITLTQGEQRRLQKAVSAKVYEFASEKDERSPLYQELYREIKDRWGVPSYRDLLRKDMQAVIKYIDAWMPKKVCR